MRNGIYEAKGLARASSDLHVWTVEIHPPLQSRNCTSVTCCATFCLWWHVYRTRNTNLEKLLAHDNCIAEIPIDVAKLKALKVSSNAHVCV